MISPLSAVAETVKISETDASPVNTMAVLQSTGPGVHTGEELTQGEIHLEGYGQSCGDSDVNACCKDKLWSLSEGELRTLAKVSEDSIAQKIGGPCSSVGVDVIVLGGSGCKNKAEEGGMHLGLTPVKIPRSSSSCEYGCFGQVTK